jgi:4-hydroxy-3-methylbut-2-en-1-yl diphosphate reductase
MGPAHAAATAARLRLGERRGAGKDGEPGEAGGAVVVAGVAGGLDPSLRHGDVVIADRVLDRDGRAVGPALPSVAALAEALTGVGLTVRVGPIITVDRLVSGSPQHRASLFATGAVAVDMESAPLVTAASPGRVAVVRTISDTAEHRMLSPVIIRGGILALGSLRRAAPMAARWALSPG